MLERTKAENTAREKLHAYITASLAYQGTHSKHNIALLEIVFNARTPENVPYYKLSDDEEEPVILELKQILRDGQIKGGISPVQCSCDGRCHKWSYRGVYV